jgi:hypothetical protein
MVKLWIVLDLYISYIVKIIKEQLGEDRRLL